MSMRTWDIETTTRTAFKRKGSPFVQENWVVLHGWKTKDEPQQHAHYFGNQRPGPGWLRPVLAGTRLLCGFNIKFDLLHALQDADNLEAWMDYIVGGGQIWDCQLAEYLLEGMVQSAQYLSLDDTAPRYGGNVKVDAVKALWNAGVSTEDIDRELLERYLLGGPDEFGVEQKGDILNTEAIALAQIKRARECGQINSILLNMGALVCTIEMERNGMFVDKPLGLILADKLKAQVDELKVELSAYMPAGMPFEFNWNSRFHKSALIFGGEVQYESYEYLQKDGTYLPEPGQPTQAFVQMDVPHCYTLEGELITVEEAKRRDVPVQRYSAGKNMGEVKTKKAKVDDPSKPKGRKCKAPYRFLGYTPPRKEWESSDPGVYSTAAEVIETLGNVSDVPFLKAYAKLMAMTKDLGTYFITTDPETGEQKGMLTLVGLDGIIHHSLNHVSTVTARLSSSDPNLTNIPKGNKSKVKEVFVSRFKDGVIVQSDFKSLEVYIQAILTKCKQLIQDLRDGLDMHCVRVSQTYGITYEEALVRCKGDKKAGTPYIPEWDVKRTEAKVFSFQRAYGAGAQKISDSTGIPISTVLQLIEADNERYPEIEPYFEARTAEIKRNRRPTGRTIPHPTVRGVMCQLGRSHVRTPDGKLYVYDEHPAPEYLVKKGILTSFSPTEIKNYEVQGGGGEWAKAAMWLAVRAFYARRNFGGLALLVNMVHDALYLDACSSKVREAAALLHACMEGASEYMEWMFQWEVPVPVPSDTGWSASMMGSENDPSVDQELADTFRLELRNTYMGGYVPSFEQRTH